MRESCMPGGTPHRLTTHPTGRMRLRSAWFGRPIAQVEEEHTTRRLFGDQVIAQWTTWRDARRADVVTSASGGNHA